MPAANTHNTHGHTIIICIYMVPMLTEVKVMHVKDNTISHGGWRNGGNSL